VIKTPLPSSFGVSFMRPSILPLLALSSLLLAPAVAEASHAVTLVNVSQKDPNAGNANLPAGGCLTGGGNTIGVQVSSGSSTCGGANYYVQVEIVPTSSSFTGSVTCTGATQNNFKPSCVVKPYPQINCGGLLTNTDYKWRARERTTGGSTGPWTNFGSSSGTDFSTGGTSTSVDAGGPYTVNEGSSVTVTASSPGCGGGTFDWDFDNDGVYDDATGVSAVLDAGALGFNGTTTVTIGVQNTDATGAVFTDTAVVNVDNVAPTIDSTSFTTGTHDEGQSLPFSVTASDAGNDPLTYAWTVTDPNGNVTQTATGASTSFAFSANGVLTVEVEVDDGEATTSYSDVVEITNLPPSITSTPVTEATEGLLYSYQVTATDPGNDVLSFQLFTGPASATVDATGLIEWTPTYQEVGGNTFRVVAVDDSGASDNQLWSVTVIFIDDDGDGISDLWEANNGLDVTVDDSAEDPDADGRPNIQEYQEGTDPQVFDGPTAPTLVEPLDWAEIGLLRPALIWSDATHPLGDPITHDVEIYSDDTLETLVTSTTGYVGDGGGQGLWAVNVELEENGRYWWRARATDAYVGGPWTEPGTFFVSLVNDVPPTPAAIYPVGGELVETTLPTLQWSEVEDIEFDAVTYEARVWDEAMENVIAEYSSAAGARDEDWTVEVGLEEDGVYAWEVRAVDEHGASSEWSPAELFRASAFNSAPDEVEWVSPEADAEMDERSPVLVVTASTDAEGGELTYEFLIDERATLDSPDLIELTALGPPDEDGNISIDLSAEDVAVVLQDDRDYWARARAVDDEGMGSSWAQVRFHVNRRAADNGGDDNRGGCGARADLSGTSAGSAGAWGLLLLAVLGLRRRRG